MEEAFEDSQSLEMQIEATPEEQIPFPEEKSDAELSADLEDLIIDTSDGPAVDAELEDEDDAVSLDFEDLSGDSLELDIEPEATALDLDEPSDQEQLTAFEEDIIEPGEDEFPTTIDEVISDDALETVGPKEEVESVDLEDLELDLEFEEPNGKPS